MAFDKRILVHVLFWILHSSVGFVAWDLGNYDPHRLGIFIAIVGFSKLTTLLYFYFNYSVLVPFLLLRKKYVPYIFIVLIATILFALSKSYIWNNFQMTDHFFASHLRSGILFTILFYFCLSTAFRMYEYWQESENRKIILLQEVKETELLYLKSQMSPHFLFNTLNNIYGLSLKKSSKTSLSVSQLKDLMLYIETFETVSKISLEEEVHYLKSFIALNQLRYSTPVHFKITDIEAQPISIEPMLLLPFIENAFKHGSINESSSIEISISAREEVLYFDVKNNIDLHKRKDNVGGIGIKNVKRRLELLYPQAFTLFTKKSSTGQFHVALTLNIV